MERDVAAAVGLFLASDGDARWWRDATGADLEADAWAAVERPACEEMSARFAALLRSLGRDVRVVRGSESTYVYDSLVDCHVWVECDGVAYDWTVRQFYSLRGPAGEQARVCEVPLVWAAGEPHPLVPFSVTEVLGV